MISARWRSTGSSTTARRWIETTTKTSPSRAALALTSATPKSCQALGSYAASISGALRGNQALVVAIGSRRRGRAAIPALLRHRLLREPGGVEGVGAVPVAVVAHDPAVAQREQVSEFGFDGHTALLAPRSLPREHEHPVPAELDEALGFDAQVRERLEVLAKCGQELIETEPPPLHVWGLGADPRMLDIGVEEVRREVAGGPMLVDPAEYFDVLLRHRPRSISRGWRQSWATEDLQESQPSLIADERLDWLRASGLRFAEPDLALSAEGEGFEPSSRP